MNTLYRVSKDERLPKGEQYFAEVRHQWWIFRSPWFPVERKAPVRIGDKLVSSQRLYSSKMDAFAAIQSDVKRRSSQSKRAIAYYTPESLTESYND